MATKLRKKQTRSAKIKLKIFNIWQISIFFAQKQRITKRKNPSFWDVFCVKKLTFGVFCDKKKGAYVIRPYCRIPLGMHRSVETYAQKQNSIPSECYLLPHRYGLQTRTSGGCFKWIFKFSTLSIAECHI